MMGLLKVPVILLLERVCPLDKAAFQRLHPHESVL
jgi:hypothetical protein